MHCVKGSSTTETTLNAEKSRSTLASRLCCMEERPVGSQGGESEISRPAVTDLPAGSGHLIAGICPSAESAAELCRQHTCRWSPGGKNLGTLSPISQSMCVHQDPSHCLQGSTRKEFARCSPHLKYRRQMSHNGRDLYAHHTCMIAHELCMEALAALTRTCRTWA